MAGLTVEIGHRFGSISSYCKNYKADFDCPDISVSVSETDIAYEREKSRREYEFEGLDYPGFSDPELELTAVYRKIAKKLPSFGGFVFHGSAVAVGERAYLFTAKSGTGKTTHTNLWLKNIDGAYIVNGDKPIIRFMNGIPFVCGTPWSGKEGMNKNICVPLHAVCALERGKENIIERVDFREIMPLMVQQAYRPDTPSELVSTLKLVDDLSRKTAFYRLHCNMDKEAAFTAFGELSK